MLFIIDRVHNTFGFKLNGDLKLGFDSFWVIICRLSHMHRFDNHFVRTHLSNHKCHFSLKSKFSLWSPRESTSLISSCWECNWLIAPAAILWQPARSSHRVHAHQGRSQPRIQRHACPWEMRDSSDVQL